ncbi:MAG: VanZ family protein [Thomasclavelia sp.]
MKNKLIFIIMLCLYIFFLTVGIYASTGVNSNGIGKLPYFQRIVVCSNLIPFYDFGPTKSLIINFFMYMPLAILAPGIFDCLKAKKNYLIFIILFITVVKLVQIITLKGYFDINDIIIGSFGSYLAYYITTILTKIIPKQSKSII